MVVLIAVMVLVVVVVAVVTNVVKVAAVIVEAGMVVCEGMKSAVAVDVMPVEVYVSVIMVVEFLKSGWFVVNVAVVMVMLSEESMPVKFDLPLSPLLCIPVLPSSAAASREVLTSTASCFTASILKLAVVFTVTGFVLDLLATTQVPDASTVVPATVKVIKSVA